MQCTHKHKHTHNNDEQTNENPTRGCTAPSAAGQAQHLLVVVVVARRLLSVRLWCIMFFFCAPCLVWHRVASSSCICSISYRASCTGSFNTYFYNYESVLTIIMLNTHTKKPCTIYRRPRLPRAHRRAHIKRMLIAKAQTRTRSRLH